MKRQIVRVAKPIVERFPRLAMTYRCLRDSLKTIEEPQQTPLGFKLAGNTEMQQGLFEADETRLVEGILSKVDIFINIGANIGYYCCIALKQGKYVVAVEPMELNLKYLLRNIKANHWESQIEVYPLALSNKKAGVLEIYGGGTGASLVKGWMNTAEHHVTLVPSTTLDNLLDTKFHGKQCLILVDIEGAEHFMLEGSPSTLTMDPKPIWLVEISVSKHQPKGVDVNPNLVSTFEVFWKNGYEAWTADDQCRIVQPAEVEQIARTGADTLGMNNFFFIESGRRNDFLSG